MRRPTLTGSLQHEEPSQFPKPLGQYRPSLTPASAPLVFLDVTLRPWGSCCPSSRWWLCLLATQYLLTRHLGHSVTCSAGLCQLAVSVGACVCVFVFLCVNACVFLCACASVVICVLVLFMCAGVVICVCMLYICVFMCMFVFLYVCALLCLFLYAICLCVRLFSWVCSQIFVLECLSVCLSYWCVFCVSFCAYMHVLLRVLFLYLFVCVPVSALLFIHCLGK